MASLARRIAPAAALGGLAVVIVGVADPAIANLGGAPDLEPTAAAPVVESEERLDEATPTDSSAQDDTATTDAPAATDCSTGETVTGDSVMTRWGPVQVAAKVSGGAVCEVHAVAWPANDGRSQMINAYAIPILDEAATASQGTQIDYVSGATYTSDSYAQSLQSILDRL